MNIDVTATIKDFEGTVLLVPNPKGNPKNATIRWACVEALMAMYQDEQTLAGEEKLKRYLLAQKIQKQKTPDLKAEEISLIKTLVGKNFTPAVVGPVYMVLEGKALHLVESGGDDEGEELPLAAEEAAEVKA